LRTTKTKTLLSLCVLCALCGESFGFATAADWPQLQNGPQRLGYSPEKVDLPLKVAWLHPFSPERLHPQAQPVIADGKVFIGTEMGTLYAIDAQTGKEVWHAKVGGPILHTAGVAGGQVFFACLDGKVYARQTADGAESWTFDNRLPTGFSSAVLLSEGNVYAANRGGTYFALSQKDGSDVWRRELGVPLLMSSAYNDGLLFFGGMDMCCYALDARTGQVRWKSEVLPGAAFKDYWPVACQGYVLLRPMRSSSKWTGPAIEWQSGPLPETELAKQEKRIENITKSGDKDFFVLNQADGKEAFVVPHWTTTTMNGAVAPPSVDGDGLLIVPVTIHDWRGGWGRLDLAKRRVVELLCEGPPDKDAKKQPAGMGNGDENMLACAAGRLAFVLHTQEGNANYTGVWQLDRRKWEHIQAAHADRFFSSNTQGGGGTPGAIAGGMLYHTSCNTLNARRLKVVGGP
jgi:outer membrane protein assembly factor BamB